MTVTFQHTREELLAMGSTFRVKQPTWPGTLYHCGVLPIVFLVVTASSSFNVATFVVLFVFLGGGITTYLQERLAREVTYSEDNLALYLKPITYTIDSEGVHYRNPLVEGTFRWLAFADVRRAGAYIGLEVCPGNVHSIPVRAFANSDEAKRFYELARQFHAAARQAAETNRTP